MCELRRTTFRLTRSYLNDGTTAEMVYSACTYTWGKIESDCAQVICVPLMTAGAMRIAHLFGFISECREHKFS